MRTLRKPRIRIVGSPFMATDSRLTDKHPAKMCELSQLTTFLFKHLACFHLKHHLHVTVCDMINVINRLIGCLNICLMPENYLL
jgi:hypothetical protein